jgi:hypothetical protein
VGSFRHVPSTEFFLWHHSQKTWLFPFFFKRNRTKRLLYESTSAFVQDVGKSYVESGLPRSRQAREGPLWLRILSGNIIGMWVHDTYVPILTEGVLRAAIQERVAVAGTQLLLAARAYRLERGVLPESLEDLVPGYLPGIPIDAFDGKPFRYSSEKGVIYSIGGDLVDDGGDSSQRCPVRFDMLEWGWRGDPSWRIEWE